MLLAIRSSFSDFPSNQKACSVDAFRRRNMRETRAAQSVADLLQPFLRIALCVVVDLQNDSGSLEKLIGSYVDGGAEVLLLYDCIGFIESFQYQ